MIPAALAGENVLVLAAQPGDELRACGAWIAALCAAGRPPFVVVVGDGPMPGAAADAEVRRGLAGLGLDPGRLLMFGIAGRPPAAGPVFEAAVTALGFVTWRHDCNLLLAPRAEPVAPIAQAAAARSGLALALYDEDATLTPPGQ